MSKPPREIRPDRIDEQNLMSRIAKQDPEAFAEFDFKYRNLIFSTAHKVLTNVHDCEDITNEVLITVWKKAAQYDSHRGNLVTWICTTTRNRAIDKLRSINRKSELLDKFKDSETVIRGEVTCGFSRVLRADTRNYLNEQIDSLPAKQADVIRLIYLKGLTQKQAAEKLQRPIGTVKAQMTRGLKSIRKKVEENVTLSDFSGT